MVGMQLPYQPYQPSYVGQLAALQAQMQQPMQLQQQRPHVSGREEAMSRFLMMYPASVLTPGFISDALFDIDRRHFHTLSIEPDGSRNLETFSYQLDTAAQGAGHDHVSRAEFDELLCRVNQMTGALNGIHEPVQAAAPTDAAATA